MDSSYVSPVIRRYDASSNHPGGKAAIRAPGHNCFLTWNIMHMWVSGQAKGLQNLSIAGSNPAMCSMQGLVVWVEHYLMKVKESVRVGYLAPIGNIKTQRY